jgi:hypothetical protein
VAKLPPPSSPPSSSPAPSDGGREPGEIIRDGRPLKDEAFEQTVISEDEVNEVDENGWASGGVFRDNGKGGLRRLKDTAFELADPRRAPALAKDPILSERLKATDWVARATKVAPQRPGEFDEDYHEFLSKFSASTGQNRGKGWQPAYIRQILAELEK